MNKLKSLILIVISIGSVSFVSAESYAKTSTKMSGDNSAINQRDGSVAELTADQQKSNTSDMLITAQIRKDILKQKNLSTYAQNIKIITINGVVTLKGPVRTMSEENSILKYARSVAGVSNVVNEIAITPEKK